MLTQAFVNVTGHVDVASFTATLSCVNKAGRGTLTTTSQDGIVYKGQLKFDVHDDDHVEVHKRDYCTDANVTIKGACKSAICSSRRLSAPSSPPRWGMR